MDVAIVSSPDGDWVGMYVSGKLVAEGHSLSERDVVEALGFVPTVVEVDFETLPANYSDLPVRT